VQTYICLSELSYLSARDATVVNLSDRQMAGARCQETRIARIHLQESFLNIRSFLNWPASGKCKQILINNFHNNIHLFDLISTHIIFLHAGYTDSPTIIYGLSHYVNKEITLELK